MSFAVDKKGKVFMTKRGLLSVSSSVSEKTKEKLDDISYKKRLPVSKLIAIAIDNEFETQDPFNFNCDPPVEPYVDGEFAHQAGKIYRYLCEKFLMGIGIDTLMMCREDIGIADKKTFLFAYRELLMREMIEEYRPGMESIYKRYAKDYNYVRPAKHHMPYLTAKLKKEQGPLDEA